MISRMHVHKYAAGKSNEKDKESNRNGEVTTRRVDPGVLKRALKLADGDLNRISVNDDGSITIVNHKGLR